MATSCELRQCLGTTEDEAGGTAVLQQLLSTLMSSNLRAAQSGGEYESTGGWYNSVSSGLDSCPAPSGSLALQPLTGQGRAALQPLGP